MKLSRTDHPAPSFRINQQIILILKSRDFIKSLLIVVCVGYEFVHNAPVTGEICLQPVLHLLLQIMDMISEAAHEC
jgi:hypothetical protein